MTMTISSILAQGGGGGGSPFGPLLIFIPMIVIMYLLMIKPQQKKQREQQEMLKKLKVGDRVVTTGGIYATILAVREKTFLVKIAENTKVEISRSSVAVMVNEEEGETQKSK